MVAPWSGNKAHHVRYLVEFLRGSRGRTKKAPNLLPLLHHVAKILTVITSEAPGKLSRRVEEALGNLCQDVGHSAT